MMNICFIGFGHMAKAIAGGLAQQPEYRLSATSPSLTPGVNKKQIQTFNDNTLAIKTADIIILAVKPAQMSGVLNEIKHSIPEHCLLISVAAGLSLAWFERFCGNKQAIIRTMPNTPAAVGLGATPMIANSAASLEHRKWAERIFSHVGITSWTEHEPDMDSFTALSGSGPAYIFSFIEALIQGAVALGLDELTAKDFAMQTVQGALNLAQNSDLSLSELRTGVTSPGGTTAAALNILHEPLADLVHKAMRAAQQRAQQLGQLH